MSRDSELDQNLSGDFPKKFSSDLNEIWYVGRGQSVMHDGMLYGRNQGQGQGHSREVDPQSPTGLFFWHVLSVSVATEAVARIQEIIDGKNLRRDFHSSAAANSQSSSVGWTAPLSSSSGISSSVSFTFCF